MRVVMVSQFYAPVVGGVERAVEDLSVALVRRGHHVAVATLGRDGLPPFEIVGGVRVHRIRSFLQRVPGIYTDPERPHVPPAPDPAAVAGLRQVMAAERPDVIHAHDWLVHSVVPLKRRGRVPLVLSLHDYGLICANKRLMRGDEPCDGPEFGKCLRCAAHQYGPAKGVTTAVALRVGRRRLESALARLLPVSRAVAESGGVIGRGVPWEVVPNLLAETTLHFDDTSTNDHEPRPVLPDPGFLLFVGDVAKDKGVEVLLDAHRRLGSQPPLVLIGRDMMGIEKRGLPSVRVLGRLAHGDVLRAMGRCSLLVSPSLCAETFGIAVLEAMAMAKPIVAARVGGLSETVVEGENGVLTPPGDADALARSIASLLSDPELLARMGAAARRSAEAFGESVVVSQVERIYREVAGRREGDPRAESEARVLGSAG